MVGRNVAERDVQRVGIGEIHAAVGFVCNIHFIQDLVMDFLKLILRDHVLPADRHPGVFVQSPKFARGHGRTGGEEGDGLEGKIIVAVSKDLVAVFITEIGTVFSHHVFFSAGNGQLIFLLNACGDFGKMGVHGFFFLFVSQSADHGNVDIQVPVHIGIFDGVTDIKVKGIFLISDQHSLVSGYFKLYFTVGARCDLVFVEGDHQAAGFIHIPVMEFLDIREGNIEILLVQPENLFVFAFIFLFHGIKDHAFDLCQPFFICQVAEFYLFPAVFVQCPVIIDGHGRTGGIKDLGLEHKVIRVVGDHVIGIFIPEAGRFIPFKVLFKIALVCLIFFADFIGRGQEIFIQFCLFFFIGHAADLRNGDVEIPVFRIVDSGRTLRQFKMIISIGLICADDGAEGEHQDKQ